MADEDALPTDARDETLARALEVEPLDELTRRRLVSGALAAADAGPEEEAAPTQATARARALAIAAAAVAFVVLGVAALTLPGGDSADVASRASRTQRDQVEQVPEAAGAPSAASGSSTAAAAPSSADARTSAGLANALPDLGQLGDLGAPGSRARVVAEAQRVVGGVEPQEWSLLFQSCPPHTQAMVATGLGTIDGEPVQVVVSHRDNGSLRVRVIDGTTCKLRSLS